MTFAPVQPRELGPLAESPLRLALVQARTTPVLAVERTEAVEQLVQTLAGDWTLVDRQSNREVALQVGPGGVKQQAGSPETVWVLTSDDASARAAVSASSVAIETESYATWDVFRAAIEEVLTAVLSTFAPKRCIRLGVRYVNEVDVATAGQNPDSLAELINSALLAPAIAIGQPIVSSLAELRTSMEDEAVFALRHGLVSPSTYLLDFDAFRESTEDFDPAVLTERVERFHDLIESVFAWCLTDAHLDRLRGDPQAAS